MEGGREQGFRLTPATSFGVTFIKAALPRAWLWSFPLQRGLTRILCSLSYGKGVRVTALASCPSLDTFSLFCLSSQASLPSDSPTPLPFHP